MDIIVQNIRGQLFHQRATDGYINATLLCKHYNQIAGKKRDANDWLSNKRTQETIKHLELHLESITGKSGIELVQAFRGSPENGGGTWLHPKLSVRFGIWLSDDFGYLVEECVEAWSQNQGFSSISEHVISVTTQAIIDNEANWDYEARRARERREIENLGN